MCPSKAMHIINADPNTSILFAFAILSFSFPSIHRLSLGQENSITDQE